MKKILPVLLIAAMLAGCQGLLPPPVDPTPSDIEMQTRVAQILTSMPTPTIEVTADIKQPPSSIPTATVAPATETIPPGPTDTLPAPTATEAPPLPTAEPTAGEAVIPTVAITPLTTSSAPTAAVTLPAAQPTPTPAAGDPRTRLGGASWTDNMDGSEDWPDDDDQYTSIDFTNGLMVLTAESQTDGWRLSWPTIKNFYLEATVKPAACSGSDHYGLILRVPEPHEADQGYLLGLTCDGRYSLRRWNGRTGAKGEMVWLINWKNSSAILSGANQTNRLGIHAQGDRLVVYINGVQVDQVNDNMFTQEGGFGVFIGMDETEDFTIYIDEVSYWEDPNL